MRSQKMTEFIQNTDTKRLMNSQIEYKERLLHQIIY